MAVLANKITVDLQQNRLFIDGKEFPWYIGDSPSIYGLSSREVLRVTVDILADDIEIIPASRRTGNG